VRAQRSEEARRRPKGGLKVSRSRLFATAAREYLGRHPVPAGATEAWNRAILKAGQPGDEPAAAAARKRSNRHPNDPAEAPVIRRGQIWWMDFAEPRGSEPGLQAFSGAFLYVSTTSTTLV
jgi:hypothetical protein